MANLPLGELPEALRSSGFSRLAAIASEGIFLADARGQLLYLNPAAEAVTGVAAARAAGQAWLELVAREDRPRAKRQWAVAQSSGQPFCQEVRCRAGRQIHWTIFRAARLGPGGAAAGAMVGAIQDVTAARQSQERSRQFFHHALDLIGVVDLQQMRLERVNPALARVFGYSAAEFLAQADAGIHPDDRPAARAHGEALRRGLPVESVVRHRSRSGEFRSIAWSACPVLGTGKAYVLGRDVTGALQAGEAGRRMTALAAHTADMIETAALDGAVTYVNPAGLALLGWTAVPPGSTLADFFPPDRRAPSLAMVRAKQMQGEGWESEVELYNHATGERIPVHAKAFAIRDAAGQPVARAFIARDMRQWRQAEAALRQSEKLAAMGRVAAAIAHEINNPLAAAVNLAYVLTHYAHLDRPAQRLARDLAQELARITAITRQTLGYYRSEPALAKVPLAELLNGVLGAFSARLTTRIVLEKRLDGRITINGALNELRQVLINLVANALDAMDAEGGKLTVRLAAGHDWEDPRRAGALITITDTGPGIAEADRQRIFDPFFTTKAAGTGLGLWVSAGIIRQHQGAIRCRQARGGGSCFEVFLPATRKP